MPNSNPWCESTAKQQLTDGPWEPGSIRHTLVALAYRTGQPLIGPEGLENWHPRDIATLVDILEEERAAQKRASQ